MSKFDMKIGDIIKIIGTKAEQVVISCRLKEDKAYDGSYWVYEFTTIEIPKHNALTKALDSNLTKTNPKENHYYLSGYSMMGKGKEVNAADVKLIGQCKLNKEVEVTYSFDKVRMI